VVRELREHKVLKGQPVLKVLRVVKELRELKEQ